MQIVRALRLKEARSMPSQHEQRRLSLVGCDGISFTVANASATWAVKQRNINAQTEGHW